MSTPFSENLPRISILQNLLPDGGLMIEGLHDFPNQVDGSGGDQRLTGSPHRTEPGRGEKVPHPAAVDQPSEGGGNL